MQLPIKLYKSTDFSGYESKDVAEYMKKIGKLEAWKKWSFGSTGAILGGKFICFQWDVERFLEGRDNID